MNRQQRRAMTVRDPKGNKLNVQMLRIIERDALGRPTLTRICWDEELLGDVVDGDRNPEFVLIWMGDKDWRPS